MFIPIKKRKLYASPLPGTLINSEQAQGLIGYWNFNDVDSSRTLAEDYSGYGNNGILVNSPKPILGDMGQYLNFNGTNQGINVGNVGIYNFERTNQFSGSAWAYSNDTTKYYMMFGKYSMINPYPGWGFQLFNRSALNGTAIALALVNNGATTNYIEVQSPAGSISAGKFYHVAFTYNGSNNASGVKLYINGLLQTNTVNFNSLTGSILSSTKFGIGYRDPDNPAMFMNGNIFDVRLYNRILSQLEIINLYKNPFDIFWQSNRNFYISSTPQILNKNYKFFSMF